MSGTEKTNNKRRSSTLQRNILILLAMYDKRLPGPVATRELERLISKKSGKAVYGPNLRNSCRRLESSGLLRTLRATNLQLVVELTADGREVATQLLLKEQEVESASLRGTDRRVLLSQTASSHLHDMEFDIGGKIYTGARGAFLVRLDGTTSLLLWRKDRRQTQLDGDALQVASWYQICFNAGLPMHTQVNE